MAVRRRRRNTGMPTTGALLVNPRRRRRKATTKRRKASHRRRPNTSKVARSKAAKLGWARRRRNGTKAGAKRKTARRAYMKRRNTRRGGVRKTARRAYMKRNTRRGGVRKTARRAYMKRNTRRTARRAYTRRRNVGMVTGVQQGLRRLPVIGKPLAQMVGFAPQAVFGAITVEPSLQLLKQFGRYLPVPVQAFNFTIAGTVMGVLIGYIPSKMLKSGLKKQLAIAAATAGGAIDYYRWRTDQSTVDDMEAQGVDGFGDYGALLTTAGYGGLLPVGGYGSCHGSYADYSDADYSDAYYSGDDMTSDEASAILAGPRQFRARFPRRATRAGTSQQGKPSIHAGKHGHRWGWLAKWIGFQGLAQVTQLPAHQRRQVIAQLRKSAIASLPEIMAGVRSSPGPVDPSGGTTADETNAAGYGALLTTAGW